MIRLLVPIAALMTLSACSTTQVVQVLPIDGVISGQCHTDRVRGAVGLAATAQTIERARVDSDSIQVQVVRGTLDSSGVAASAPAVESGGERLTVETGTTNSITAIRCG